MVFGRFGGDKRVEVQRQKLAELEMRLAATERAVASHAQLRQQFADVWFDSPERDKAVERLGNARALLEGCRTLAAGKTYRESVDESIELLDKFIEGITVDVDSFGAILISRQHLWSARADGKPFDPTMRDSQRALHASGSSLADDVQKHIDELRPIRQKHQGPWPARLDLDTLQARVDESRKALAIYQERFESHDEALPPQSSITLLMIAQDMENALDIIEHERPNLAMDTLMRGLLKNSGSSHAAD